MTSRKRIHDGGSNDAQSTSEDDGSSVSSNDKQIHNSNERTSLSNAGAIIIQASAMFGLAPLIFPHVVVEVGGVVRFIALMTFVLVILFYCLSLIKECTAVMIERHEDARKIIADSDTKSPASDDADDTEERMIRDPIPVLMELAGGSMMRCFAIVLLCIVFVANALGDLLTASNVMHTAFPFQFTEEQSIRLWILILSLMTLPVTYIGYFKELVLTATFGFLGSVTCGICVFAATFQTYSNGDYSTDDSELPVPTFFSVMGAVGQFLFAMGGCGLLLPNLMGEMKNHTHIKVVMAVPFIVVSICYLGAALPPFLVFKNLVRPNILMTLRTLPIRDTSLTFDALLLVAQISVSLHLLTQLVVWMNTVWQIIENAMRIPIELCWQRIAIRSCGMFLICSLALAIPAFEPVLTFVGGVLQNLMLVAMPVYLYWSLFPERVTRYHTIGFCTILLLVLFVMVSSAAIQLQNAIVYWKRFSIAIL